MDLSPSAVTSSSCQPFAVTEHSDLEQESKNKSPHSLICLESNFASQEPNIKVNAEVVLTVWFLEFGSLDLLAAQPVFLALSLNMFFFF